MKYLSLIFVLFCSISEGAFTLPTINLPGNVIRPETFKSQICQQSCVDGVVKVHLLQTGETSGEKKCPAQAELAFACGGYNCSRDGKNCMVFCENNENCSLGYICESRKCIPERPVSYYCASNETVASSKGESWNCAPMICQAGRCKEKCVTTSDCAGSAVCDTSNGSCVYVR
jgi:hypothetical protein